MSETPPWAQTRVERWKKRAANLKADTYALYLACRDPRAPWYTKVLVAIIVAYALSPIDLIPDFIPVIGYLDDLLIVPAGISLAVKLIPHEVLAEHREAAARRFADKRPGSWTGAAIVLVVWLAALLWAGWVLFRLVKD